MKRAHVLIYGKVQGVWFRAHTKKEANRIGICGWVRNVKDGSVEAIFEGSDNQIGEFRGQVHIRHFQRPRGYRTASARHGLPQQRRTRIGTALEQGIAHLQQSLFIGNGRQ